MTEQKDDAFDQALELTFPASDPIAVSARAGFQVGDRGTKTETSYARLALGPAPPPKVLQKDVLPWQSACVQFVTRCLVLFLFMGLVAIATSAHLLANDAAVTRSDGVSDLSSVLGAEVRSYGKTVGRIVDLLARPDGAVEAAVVEYGGFLGIGSRKVAVGWSRLRFEREGKRLFAITDLAPDELAASSDY